MDKINVSEPCVTAARKLGHFHRNRYFFLEWKIHFGSYQRREVIVSDSEEYDLDGKVS